MVSNKLIPITQPVHLTILAQSGAPHLGQSFQNIHGSYVTGKTNDKRIHMIFENSKVVQQTQEQIWWELAKPPKVASGRSVQLPHWQLRVTSWYLLHWLLHYWRKPWRSPFLCPYICICIWTIIFVSSAVIQIHDTTGKQIVSSYFGGCSSRWLCVRAM